MRGTNVSKEKKTRLIAFIAFGVLAAVIVAVGIIGYIKGNSYDTTDVGNTHSNIANRPVVNKSDSKFYFADNYIYEIDENNKCSVFVEHEATDLMIHDGWIYYVNYDDGQLIYRTNLETRESEIVSTKAGGYINIVDDTLYYASLYGTSYSGIYKVDLNNIDKDNPQVVTVDWASHLLYYDNRLYFINEADASRLYSMKLDGTDRQISAGNATSCFAFHNGTLYYSNVFGIYKCRPDGSNEQQISKMRTTTFNVTDDYIYHCFYADSSSSYDQSLYRMKLDGSEEIALTADSGSNICVIDDYVYFRNVYKGQDIYRIKEDNSVFENFLKLYGVN